MSRRLTTLFILAAAVVFMSNLAACGQTAKEDPVEEQNQKQEVQQQVQQQVQEPEQTQTTEVDNTDRTVGENIQG